MQAALLFVVANLASTSAPELPSVKQAGWREPIALPAEVLPQTASSLLLDVTSAPDKFVAVGERGHVLLSDRSGKEWSQVSDVPTRASLTAVTSVRDQLWAVGHGEVVIHSGDAGLHWELQHRAESSEPETPLKTDRPLLDVLFIDAENGFAVGAYSLLLITHDGGKSWQERNILSTPTNNENSATKENATHENWMFSKQDLKLAQESDPHFNGIARTDNGSLFIAAERGAALRSRDGGETWQRLELPYEGSMFGVLGFENDHVLVFGLRGHVYESFDLGDHWKEIATHTELSIMGGTRLHDTGAILVGANGLILIRPDKDSELHSFVRPSAGTIAAAAVFGPDQTVIVGENGVSIFVPSSLAAE